MPFEKGQSGNPRGRPKSDFTLAALAKKRTHKALQLLDKVMADEAHPACVSAAKEILDRGWGKAPQKLEAEFDASDSMLEFLNRVATSGDR